MLDNAPEENQEGGALEAAQKQAGAKLKQRDSLAALSRTRLEPIQLLLRLTLRFLYPRAAHDQGWLQVVDMQMSRYADVARALAVHSFVMPADPLFLS